MRNGDGCSSTCTIENGYECAPDTSNNSISKWTLKCGNGVINSPEICDDKNNVNGEMWKRLYAAHAPSYPFSMVHVPLFLSSQNYVSTF